MPSLCQSYLWIGSTYLLLQHSPKSFLSPPKMSMFLPPGLPLTQTVGYSLIDLTRPGDWTIFPPVSSLHWFSSHHMLDGIYTIDNFINVTEVCAFHQCTYCTKKVHECVETSKHQANVFRVATMWCVHDDLCSFPVKRLIKRNNGRRMVFESEITNEVKRGQNSCLV